MKKALMTVASSLIAMTATAQMPSFPSAEASDPIKLGIMVGSPPPPDKQLRFADGSSYRFPNLRWGFSHYSQFVPTTIVSRGSAATQPLPRALRNDIDSVTFTPLGKTEPMTWAQSLNANYTDGILVMHKGQVVYERYAGALNESRHHIGMSMTKSFIGLLGALLVAEGALDENALASRYVPEFKGTAFEDATVRNLLDMRTGLKFSENYADPKAEIWAHARAGSVLPRPPGYQGPRSFYEFLQTVAKEGEHGKDFAYKTINSDALGWVVRRASGKTIGELISERIWQPMGAEWDALIGVDEVGNEFAGGGINTTLRDLARFGELMRNNGKLGDKQVLPAKLIADIQNGGDRAAFPTATYPTLKGWSYRNMWWVSHNEHGAYMARGIHGQSLYIDPTAQIVIARYGSHPIAGNIFNDPTTLPAFHAVAKHLMGK